MPTTKFLRNLARHPPLASTNSGLAVVLIVFVGFALNVSGQLSTNAARFDYHPPTLAAASPLPLDASGASAFTLTGSGFGHDADASALRLALTMGGVALNISAPRLVGDRTVVVDGGLGAQLPEGVAQLVLTVAAQSSKALGVDVNCTRPLAYKRMLVRAFAGADGPAALLELLSHGQAPST